MKCDELKYEHLDESFETYPDSTLVIRKQFVDAAIAELKAENESLKNEKKKMYTKLQHDTIIDAMSRSHLQQIRATKRAMWIARANRAIEKIAWYKLWNASISTMNPEDGARQEYDKWKKALGKFLHKAEEYK